MYLGGMKIKRSISYTISRNEDLNVFENTDAMLNPIFSELTRGDRVELKVELNM